MQEQGSRREAKTAAQFAMAFALVCLAGAIIYFTYEISRVSIQIPAILASIDQTSEKVGPIMDEVGEIRQLVPGILKEVEETRKQIPLILNEVEQTRKQIPSILKEAEALRKELPAVLASADKASVAIVTVSKEVEATRPLIPEVLKEVEATRESIPPMMEKANMLIDKARVAGREASQGAVTGIFKGIITSPFILVADAGKKLTGFGDGEAENYTEKDFDLVETSVLDLIDNGKQGDTRRWNNPDSGSRGTVTLISIYEGDELEDRECRVIRSKSFDNEDVLKEITRSLCKNEKGEWYVKDDDKSDSYE